MNTPKTTAKDFFLWAGAIVAFYWSVIAYAALVFDYINYTFPNPLAYYPVNPYESGISFEMASVIVLFPIYVLVMWFIHRDAAADPTKNEIWVRRWALIFTLFLAGVAMAGDLITLLATFLNGGELTTAFLLKVLVIFVIAGGVFTHFISDLRGYWVQHPKRLMWVRVATGVLAVATVLAGFVIVGTPQHARLERYDAQRVSDLREIQNRVTSYYQAKQKLPLASAELESALTYGPLPVDPQNGQMYIYQIDKGLSFALCTNFSTVSRDTATRGGVTYPVPAGVDGYPVKTTQDSWAHGTGYTCFTRTIDPSFYPPTTAPAKTPLY